ncbi:MAG: hypothetical protein D6725_08550, partial [Planctomycetota bacterium]
RIDGMTTGVSACSSLHLTVERTLSPRDRRIVAGPARPTPREHADVQAARFILRITPHSASVRDGPHGDVRYSARSASSANEELTMTRARRTGETHRTPPRPARKIRRLADWWFSRAVHAARSKHGRTTVRSRRWSRCAAMLCAMIVGTACVGTVRAAFQPPSADSPAEREQPSVDELIRRLRMGTAAERARAARQLGALGPQAAPAVADLIAATRNRSIAVRHEAILALGEIGPAAAAAVPRLLELLRTDDVALIQHACLHALRRIAPDDRAARKAAAALLRSSDRRVRTAAAWLIVAGDPQGRRDPGVYERAVSILIEGLDAPAEDIRSDAVEALVDAGAAVVPKLVPLLDPNRPERCVHVCDVLEGLGPAAADAADKLLQLAESTDSRICWHAVRALAAIGLPAERGVPVFRRLLKHADPRVRAAACEGLARYGGDARPALNDLRERLRGDKALLVRVAAARAIGAMGPSAAGAIADLDRTLDDAPAPVALAALNALELIGEPSVPVLTRRLEEPAWRALAAHALGNIGPSAAAAVPKLGRYVNDADETTRREVLFAIAAIGEADWPTIRRLLQIVKDENDPQRPLAIYVLGRLRVEQAEALLQHISADANADELTRFAAVWALLQIRPDDGRYRSAAAPLVTRALNNDIPLVRREAVRTAVELGLKSPPVVAAVTKLIDDPQPDVRLEALAAIADLGVWNDAVAKAVRVRLDDPVPDVRYAALHAAGSAGPNAASLVDSVSKRLDVADPFERCLAAWAMLRIAPRDVLLREQQRIADALQLALDWPDPELRRNVAAALRARADLPALAKLRERLARDPDASVRRAAGAE